MSVKIRLARHGAKKRPFYRIVVADGEAPRDGKFLEIVGTYNPRPDPVEVTLKKDRIDYWMGQGAIPSDTVKSLIKRKSQEAQPA
ncbi:MAG: 30S ribosomal protein S16 [Deltaproteobacteria bacterium]|nr:30S ribosomal protein S16 [Deltaproteobacteria bacterium]